MRPLAGTLAAAVLLAVASPAMAQRPVCEPPSRDEAVRSACAPRALFTVVRFLSDFGIDHLFKPSPPPFQKDLLGMARVFGGRQIVANKNLEDFLAAAQPLRFFQLDRTTGTFTASFEDGTRRFHGLLSGLPVEPTLTVELPSRLDGGYWRAPDVLQMVFWERHRVAIELAIAGKPVLTGPVQCLSLTPDGLVVRFEGKDAPSLLVEFRECGP